MSDPMVPGFDAVGDEALLLVHENLICEGARNGGDRTTRKQGEAIA